MAKGAKIDEPKEVAPPPDDQALLAPAPYDGCHFPERVFLERILAALKGLQLDAAASRETDCIRMLATQCMERKRLATEDSRAIQNSWRILQAYSAREAKSIAPLSKPISDLFFWTTAPKHVRRAFETQNFILAALYSYICYAKQIPQGQPELAYMWTTKFHAPTKCWNRAFVIRRGWQRSWSPVSNRASITMKRANAWRRSHTSSIVFRSNAASCSACSIAPAAARMRACAKPKIF